MENVATHTTEGDDPTCLKTQTGDKEHGKGIKRLHRGKRPIRPGGKGNEVTKIELREKVLRELKVEQTLTLLRPRGCTCKNEKERRGKIRWGFVCREVRSERKKEKEPQRRGKRRKNIPT